VTGGGGRGQGAAGWSAAAKAQEVREEGRGGALRRFLRVLGLDPGAGRVEGVAGRWEAGARGEQMTAGLLLPLADEGWGAWHDRALPMGRANFDHVLVPPCGMFLALVDSKLWSARRGQVHLAGGGLRHGGEDWSGAVRSLEYEADVLRRRVGRELRTPVVVVPVMAVHSAPVAGRKFTAGGVTVVQAGLLPGLLRRLAGRPDPVRFDRLKVAAGRVLPRYEDRAGR
jgi:hypothetical protein